MAHPHTDATDSLVDPSYNPRLRGESPSIDDTEISSDSGNPELDGKDKPLTVAEKMLYIAQEYGFLPISDAETSRVYSIAKGQGKGESLGIATRRLLQSVHRHQMYTSTEDTSSAVRAITHGFEDSAKDARRRLHFTQEFDDMLRDEANFAGTDGLSVLQVLHDGRAIQYADGPKKGLKFLGDYIAQSNKLTFDQDSGEPMLPENPLELPANKAMHLLDEMKIGNVARQAFWNTVCEGAAQHKMAHGTLKESVFLRR